MLPVGKLNVQAQQTMRRIRKLVILTGLLAIWGCATEAPVPLTVDQQLYQRAQSLAIAGDLAGALALYTELVQTSSNPALPEYLLAGARLQMNAGDTTAARLWIARARDGATLQQAEVILVLSADIELDEGRPEAAISLLDRISEPPEPQILLDALLVRGRAMFQLGRAEEAVTLFVEREFWLNDSDAVLANHEVIWSGLLGQPSDGSIHSSDDPEIDGWLALQPVASSYRSDPSGLQLGLLRWQNSYPDHPAIATFLPGLRERIRLAQIYPEQVALLLPLSSLRQQSAAIRDGFIAAHLRRTSGEDGTHVKIYDTDVLGSQEAYRRAQADGADFVVGPLLKTNVDQILASAGFVPTLALNFTQSESPMPPGLFQFALAPEDEAIEVARHAASSGASKAVALVPNSDWGFRLLDSFRDEFERQGGELRQFRSYDPNDQDFSEAITSLLNLTRSNQRFRRLAANIVPVVEFEPRRRQDIDVIFVATNPMNGRLLVPQLRFHYAGDLPTYATSDIHSPAIGADPDLDGILFPDSPWVLSPDQASADLKASFATYWPQRAAQWPRLFAMGFDAYRLIPLLSSQTAEFSAIPAMSGELSLDAEGRVHRRLPVAQFRNGRPVTAGSEEPVEFEAAVELADLR